MVYNYMNNIPIYKFEIDDGISEQVRSTANIIFTSSINIIKPDDKQVELAKHALNKIAPSYAKASIEQWDLFYFNSILASIGWNKNDDVFDNVETWIARSTPVYKQVNFMHNEKDIIGNTIASISVGADGTVIDDQISAPPDKYDILTADVLYRKWEDKNLQDRMDKLIAEILEGKWSVSMECLFKNFDYAVISSAGEHKVIPRTSESSFLTKHLRIYGGTGTYNDYKIGRLLRNFSFSGKGVVSNPANPRSVILVDGINPFKASNSLISTSIKKENSMADNDVTQSLKDELAKANARNEKLESKLNEQIEVARVAERDKFEKQIAAQKVDIEDLNKKVAAQDEEIKKVQALNLGWEKQLKEVGEKLAQAEKEVTEAKLAKLKASRITQLVSAKVAEDEAIKIVDKWSQATDEQFDDIVSLYAKKMNDGGDEYEDKTKEEYKKKKDGSKGEYDSGKEEEDEPEDAKKKDKKDKKSEATGDLDKAEVEKEAALAADSKNQENLNKTAANWFASVLRGTQNIKKNEE